MLITTVKRYTNQGHYKYRIILLKVHQLSPNLYKLVGVGRGWGYGDFQTAKEVAKAWKPNAPYCHGVEENLLITRNALEKRLKITLPETLPSLNNGDENITLIRRT